MQMPIDLRVVSNKDSVYDFTIPNTWWEKTTDHRPLTIENTNQAVQSSIVNRQSSILSKWYGWDKLQPTYDATVTIPSGIKTFG